MVTAEHFAPAKAPAASIQYEDGRAAAALDVSETYKISFSCREYSRDFSWVCPTALVIILTITAEVKNVRSYTPTHPYVFVMYTGQLKLCTPTCDKRAAENRGFPTANQKPYYAALACTWQ